MRVGSQSYHWMKRKLEEYREAVKQVLTDMEEEHGGEDGLLADAKNDKDKFTKTSVQKRMKDIKGDADFIDEFGILGKYLQLNEKETVIGKKIKEAYTVLDKKVTAKYKTLTVDEVNTIVVNDKWMMTIEKDIYSEVERIIQGLSQRIRLLADRYQIPLPKMSDAMNGFENKVNEHLKKMKFVW